MNTHNEQPEDLFDWAQTKQSDQKKEDTSPAPLKWATRDDGLGWDCKQCELNNGWCKDHPRSFPKISQEFTSSELTEEDIESSNRIADKETEIFEAKQRLEDPATPEYITESFEEMRKKLAS